MPFSEINDSDFKNLCHLYENLIAEQSQKLITSSVNKVIRHLQGRHPSLAGDDSGLKNIWDDFCVQIQYEWFVSWDVYVDYIRDYIENDVIESFTKIERLFLWMQTASFDDWSNYSLNEGKIPNNFSELYCREYEQDAVVELIYESVVSAADNYKNPRIEHYLEN